MDKALKELEQDYLDAVDNNSSSTVEAFVETFLYDSWSYNEQNLDRIKTVMSRYSQEQINAQTFSSSFSRMVDKVQGKLEELDMDKQYPVIQDGQGASLLIAIVDGLVIQYFAGTYPTDELEKRTPYFTRFITQALKTKN
ncbi:hypothetical protein GPDM_15819 [Planococcus donghaensis MPA1U2]|uniref:TetR family transcriptional regulator n=2 Tax=Planococcus donghaensis TaxID=414778 RepID=E7RKY9_9BACL|nr:hypothetical protein GPDM_15819 [Planococcus donghaensis MPA1U2]